MSSEHPESHNGVVHPSVQFERTDLSLRAVLTFAAGLVVALVVVSGGLFVMAWLLLGVPSPPAPPRPWDFEAELGPDPGASHLPAKPELEAIDENAPPGEPGVHTRPIGEQVREEEEHLKGFGWADEKKGIVYIPIEEAMERLGGKPGAAPGGPPGETAGPPAVSSSGRRIPGGAP